jgi:diguanylate cyclase (GGDEF)-like protein/PAS domain S-box-containing protein
LATFWHRLPLIGRLLTLTGLALLLAGALMIMVTARQEATELMADQRNELAKELRTIPPLLAEMAIVGDYASIQQVLDQYVTDPHVRSVEFSDASTIRIYSQDMFPPADAPQWLSAPQWFSALLGFADITGSTKLIIGGHDYGEITVTMTSQLLAERTWTHLINHLAILNLAFVLNFAGIWLILRTSLAPLRQLESGADRMASGDLDVFIPPHGSPELRHMIESFDTMARNIRIAQETLRQNERESHIKSERLAGVIWGTNIGTWEWNVQTGATIFNERWAEIVGYTLDELAPISIATWSRLVHPEDGKRSEELLNECFSHVRDDYECEARMKHKDGSWIWVLDRGRVLEWTADGKPLRMSGTHQEITERKRLEESLRNERDFTGAILDTAKSIIMVINRAGEVVRINRAAQEFTGYSFEEATGQPYFWDRFLLPEQRPQVREVFGKLVAGQVVARYENYWVRKDGSKRLFDWSNSLLFDESGKMEYLVTVGLDITERKAIEEQLQKTMRYNRSLIEASPDPLATISQEGRFMDMNQATCEITGIAREQLVGRDFADFFTDPENAREVYRQAFERGSVSDYPLSIRSAGKRITEVLLSANVLRDENGAVSGVFVAARDITKLRQTAAHLEHLAHFDTLTGLPNRVLFGDRLRQALSRAKRERSRLALMYLDLDRFKPVNDNYGHHIGDLLLAEAAKRMQDCMRESDTVARMGGDEFVILLPGIASVDDAILVADKVQEALRQPFIIENLSLEISSSVGIAIYPEHGGDEATLSQHADTAMYSAKAGGRDNAMLYQNGMADIGRTVC